MFARVGDIHAKSLPVYLMLLGLSLTPQYLLGEMQQESGTLLFLRDADAHHSEFFQSSKESTPQQDSLSAPDGGSH